MLKELERLMNLLNKKYPPYKYHGYVRLVIFSDESGFISESARKLFTFDTLKELIEHLQEK